ncbi:radical SAM protein [Clostridium tarantellae]|uniref:Radical SAM protein n=1 Tax=Clostridium tarantellae TaxID=39493 RepID=A0A6I1MRR5_9CLOT|nr:radical SAM protein [Clostridium tarantellae]MPQ44887.1 radical SAM protein [Clostridium tarantellae]
MTNQKITTKDFNYYKEFIENIKNKQSFSRLGKAFKTNNKYYYYDLGTGKVLECEKLVYQIIHCLEKSNSIDSLLELDIDESKLLKSLNILENAINVENIMKAVPLLEMIGPQTTQLEYSINNNLNQVTLELTEKCNLRCKYCIYQDENGKFRNFEGKYDMDINIAKKAIDYGIEHAKGEDFYLTFYGGEPLIQFDLITACVDYVQSKNIKNNIFYSITTNLTLMTQEKANYFASIPNFSVVCSIDGDEETHDQNRVTIDNKGTHKLAIDGLANLTRAYGEKKLGQILINMVVADPYTDEKFNRIQNFIDTCPYIYPDMTIMYSYVDYGDNSEIKTKQNLSNDEALKYWNPIQNWQKDKPSDKKLFSTNNNHRAFLKIQNRQLSNEPISYYSFNGCCVPGSRKLFVTTNGDFHVCEQIGQAPKLGNVNDGINFDLIREKYIKEYNDKSIVDCKDCWAVRLCNLCYARCYDKNGINIISKKNKCFHEKRMAEYSLQEYHRILEENPELLECLKDMK